METSTTEVRSHGLLVNLMASIFFDNGVSLQKLTAPRQIWATKSESTTASTLTQKAIWGVVSDRLSVLIQGGARGSVMSR